MPLRRLWPILLLCLLETGLILYFSIGYNLYTQFTTVEHGGDNSANLPTHFTSGFDNRDLSAYWIPAYETVTIESRQPGLHLAAWYIPADQPDAPVVILIHGTSGCKCNSSNLLAAGMLHRHGFSVADFDLRNMGLSDIEDGRHAAGTKEYLDALGVFDWLVKVKGVPSYRIGIWGVSLGAATALDAFAAEAQLAAVFADSSFSDMETIIKEELVRSGYPAWLAPGGLLMAKIISGDDLMSRSPTDAMRTHGGRPIFLAHGQLDQRIYVHHSQDLLALGQQNGANIQAWFVPNAGHIGAIWQNTAEYEQKLVAFFEQALKK